jgi:hypothetical protein
MTPINNPNVGQVNPSQLLYSYGIGAIIDLPHISVIVTGLEDWPRDPGAMREIVEPRLLRAVRAQLDMHLVKRLLFPPVADDSEGLPNPFNEEQGAGVPVATFPRWMVCPACRLLAPLASNLFELRTDPFHSDRAHYEHVNCPKPGKSPTVVPARFMVACERGHLDDFPWIEFVHRGPTDCQSLLRLAEYGPSGEARDLDVKCETCGASRRLAEAFGRENREKMPQCRGRRPHLRDFDLEPCPEKMRAIILGASNSWFPVALSTIAIPETTDKLDQLVEDNWATLKNVTTPEVLTAFYNTGMLKAFAAYPQADLWEALQRQLAREASAEAASEQPDLLLPEWTVFSQPDPARNSSDFRLKAVPPPTPYQNVIRQVVLAERLRGVEAIVGFTRIDSPGELAEPGSEDVIFTARLSRQPPEWVPAVDVRGEGIFIQFDETAIQAWLNQSAVRDHDAAFFEAHKLWRKARCLEPREARYPGLRYILLHSFAHALMRQFALECGYTAASLRERLYARAPDDTGGPMAGLLIYTAAPDSDGTLGGLVRLGEPRELERHIEAALEAMRLCASDPTCAEHPPSQSGMALHAAACHACLFASETSCESGNKYLDRAVLVPTVERDDLAFFADVNNV